MVTSPDMNKRSQLVFAGALIIATLLAYLPAMRGGFIWDDNNWTIRLSGLFQSFYGLAMMWRHPTVLQQYYPLTATTFWLDYQFWKFWTTPYHIENVLLHSLAALLFWRLLLRLRVPGAWLAAALFVLHPVMVESAAWITERKNVLSLVLYLAAFLAYLRYSEGKAMGQRDAPPTTCHPLLFYFLAFGLFLGALLAKATAFSFPAAILLVIWWQRGCLRWRLDLLPVLPFFAVTIGMGLVTLWLEKNHVGARGPDFDLSFLQRSLVAGRVFWFYLGKLLWPVHLCFIYPRWQPDPGVWWQWLYPVGALGLLSILWLGRRRLGCGPVTVGLFYVGTLFPVLGFMNAYFMRFSFVCDHLVYLSSLGIIALVAALLVRAAEVWRTPVLVYCFAVLVLPALGILTWRQCRMYTDMETFWRTTLVRNPDCWMAQNNLGAELLMQGKLAEAAKYLNQALQARPDNASTIYSLGYLLDIQGKSAEAIQHYESALRYDPDCYGARFYLGIALVQQGKSAEAIPHLERALQIHPGNAENAFYLGVAMAALGKLNEAIPCYQKALQNKPDYIDALDNLGQALARQGKTSEAITCYEKALHLKPDLAETHYHLGEALAQCEKLDTAVQHYEQALKSNPDYVDALSGLGIALFKQTNLVQAAQCFARVVQLKPDRAEYHLYLGITLLAQEKSAEAAQQIDRALNLATAQGNTALAASIRARFLSQPADSLQSQP
jgi:protein O-mannosyl-transferase